MLKFLKNHSKNKHHGRVYGHTVCAMLNGMPYVRVPGILSSGQVSLLQAQ